MSGYVMDYIPNKTLFKAVMFSRDMMRRGTRPTVANYRAAQYYRVSVTDVAKFTGQVASRVKDRKRKRRETP